MSTQVVLVCNNLMYASKLSFIKSLKRFSTLEKAKAYIIEQKTIDTVVIDYDIVSGVEELETFATQAKQMRLIVFVGHMEIPKLRSEFEDILFVARSVFFADPQKFIGTQ